MTRNLLKSGLGAAEIEKILAHHPRKPLLPVIGSEPWANAAKNPVAQKLAAPLRTLAEKECSEPLPELTDELYSSFKKTGIRLTFERQYFERRRRLARAVISLLLCSNEDPWRERLKNSAIEKFASVFEEVSWALPAHVHWHDKDDFSGKDPLQIDLFCAETANLMAEMLDLLGDIVPENLRARVRERLLRTIFENYADEQNAWRFGWKSATHNWNAVCHQGVVGAALSQLDDPRLLAKILVSAKECLPLFLGGFCNDGGCTEGPGYWSYGFGWFAMLNEQLESRTNGGLSLFEGDDHVRAIASYGPRMSLTRGKMVNFSDNGANGNLNPALLLYLGARLGEPAFESLALESYSALAAKSISLNSERTDVCYLSRILLRCPADIHAQETVKRTDCFLPDLAVVVASARDQQGRLLEFAAKAGHNDEHHNHNDCGGFILNVDGVRIVAEIGAPEYVHDFFNPAKRYEFLAARSLGHSVPLVNGCEQSAGSEFAAAVESCEMDEKHIKFVVDLTKCYPAAAKCKKLVRTFLLDKTQGKLTVTDDYELENAGSAESMIICDSPVTQDASRVQIKTSQRTVNITPAHGTVFAGAETCSYSDHEGHEQKIQRLKFHAAKAATTGSITCQFEVV